jgi:sec-independent protein translocase protein TatB
MSFSETVFLFVLALVVFGPKKLPEIARQAGKLLAELRRASNEFKSQIETEIAHLEVEKKQNVLPPSPPPQGTVASLSLNPAANVMTPHESNATLAAPMAESIAPNSNGNSSSENPSSDHSQINSTPTAPASSSSANDLETVARTQDSHA